MRLDLLSLDAAISRWTGEDTQARIKATVVPAEHEKIRVGSRHIFCKHNFHTELERIDAQLWITADADHLSNAKVLFPERLRRDEDTAGYASAAIPDKEGQPATLSFVLFVDEVRFAHLLTQVDGVAAGSIAIEVWIDGLEFGLPDEEIWEPADPDHASQYLPIRHFSIEVAKLRTTRQAIRDAREATENKELADSDDAEERKLGLAWIKDASMYAAEQSVEPSLSILRHCRALLALLLICAAVAIVQRL